MNERKLKKVPLAADTLFSDAPVVEVPVLLESSLLPVLEAAALDRGQTAGALIRRLIRDFLARSQGDPPAACEGVDVPPAQDVIV